jgi:hypothetical protein
LHCSFRWLDTCNCGPLCTCMVDCLGYLGSVQWGKWSDQEDVL